MSSTVSPDAPTRSQGPATIDMKLEVVTVPVSDVDRAKAFYADRLGWRVDADISGGDAFRIVQLTPPHSEASIAVGKGAGPLFGADEMAPGSQQRMEMVVSDLAAARQDLIDRGVDVSEPFHRGEAGMEPGIDPNRTSYNSYATFRDPDGNSWLLQEVTTRLPGRLWEN
jgi:catechol 2,3-dioxygenase-like lactoylglutathione lyase family enzyme